MANRNWRVLHARHRLRLILGAIAGHVHRGTGLVFVAILMGASADSMAADTLQADTESTQWNLADHADFLKEAEEELEIEEAAHPDLASAFKPLDSSSVNFGLAQGACWFRFTIANARPEATTFFVEMDNPRIKRVDFHTPGLDRPDAHQRAGTMVPFNDRPTPFRNGVFRLTLEPGQEQTVYLRTHHDGAYHFNLALWDTDAFVRRHTLRTGMHGVFFGSLIIMLASNFVLFVLFRDRGYLLLSISIAAFGLYMLAYHRLDSEHLWPDSPDFPGTRVSLFFGLGCCAAFLFSRDFLGMAKLAPRWDKVYLAYAGLSLFACADLFIKGMWVDWMLQFVGATAPVILVIGALICIRQGNRYALGYLIAWGGLFVTMIPFTLLGMGFIPAIPLAEHSMKIAFPITLALTSIAIWQRFREVQEEHRKNLDHQVKERTKELTEALENVKTLHGLIPICSACKSIRDDQGFWTRVESYIKDHSDADFTHSICPDCAKKLYNITLKES